MHNKIKKILILQLILFWSSNSLLATSYGLHTSEQFQKTKDATAQRIEPQTSSYNELMSLANKALDKTYQAIPTLIAYQFYTSTDAEIDRSRRHHAYLAHDAGYTYALALAYKFTGDRKYADKAIYFLSAWASINKEYKGDNFEGDNTSNYKTPGYYNQTQADLNMATAGAGFIQGAILLKDYNNWSNVDKAVFSTWCTNVYRKATDEFFLKSAWTGGNVGVSARLGIIFHHAWQGYTDALRNEDVTALKNMLDEQLRTLKYDPDHRALKNLPKGKYNIPHMLPIEVKRGTKGMWYTAWTLSSFTAAFEILLNETGTNLFPYVNAHGSTIEDAIKQFFLLKDPADWPYWDGKDGVTGTAKPPTKGGWGGKMFAAMGMKYDRPEWTTYADSVITVLPSTQINWNLPTLFHPASYNTQTQNNDSTIDKLVTGAFIIDPVSKKFY